MTTCEHEAGTAIWQGGVKSARLVGRSGMVAVDGRGGRGGGLLLLVLLVLVLFCTSGDQCILLGKNTDNSGGDFVVDYCYVVFANDVDTEFLRISVYGF